MPSRRSKNQQFSSIGQIDTELVHDRMTAIFEKATSAQCRAKIATHFGYWINVIGNDKAAFPFVGAAIFENSKIIKNTNYIKLLRDEQTPSDTTGLKFFHA